MDYIKGDNTIREPSLPIDTILDAANPIEPVPGGGVIVFMDDANQVLMTLVLKRGMLRWELPAGVAKDGEPMEEAAKRSNRRDRKQIEIGKAVAMCWQLSINSIRDGWVSYSKANLLTIIQSLTLRF
ncbi:MAG: NUDIX hydrolase [Desulfobacterales bacterium]